MCQRSHWQNPFLFEKYCKRMEALATIPFLFGQWVILKSLQQQLQLFIKYSIFFRRVIVVISTCNDDFQNKYFLQRAINSEHLV